MDNAKNNRYNKKNVILKTLPQKQNHFLQNLHSTFRQSPQTENSEGNYIYQQYGFNPYWEDHIYNQDNLENRHNHEKPTEQIEVDNIIDVSHVSHATT